MSTAMITALRPLPRLSLLLLLSSCLAAPAGQSSQDLHQDPAADVRAWRYQPDLPVSRPPFATVHANWKQRLAQPYVYVEYTGSYTETGRLLPLVHRALLEQGLEPSGPPFALYYDDPGRVPVNELRSRACVPIAAPARVGGELAADVLESTTVAYAVVSGPYPQVPLAYPGLYAYMGRMGWVEDGPVREIYLVPPSTVADYAELLTEVQVPVTYPR